MIVLLRKRLSSIEYVVSALASVNADFFSKKIGNYATILGLWTRLHSLREFRRARGADKIVLNNHQLHCFCSGVTEDLDWVP